MSEYTIPSINVPKQQTQMFHGIMEGQSTVLTNSLCLATTDPVILAVSITMIIQMPCDDCEQGSFVDAHTAPQGMRIVPESYADQQSASPKTRIEPSITRSDVEAVQPRPLELLTGCLSSVLIKRPIQVLHRDFLTQWFFMCPQWLRMPQST